MTLPFHPYAKVFPLLSVDALHLLADDIMMFGLREPIVLYVTNGVSLLQTNKHNSTCWPYCHGHALPPRWSKACNPARNGGVYDHHHRFYHGLILSGR